VIAARSAPKQRGAAPLGSLVGHSPRVTPRPERSSRQGSISGQPPSAMASDPFMPTGSSRPASTPDDLATYSARHARRRTSTLPVLRSSRPFETAVDTLLALAHRQNEPKPGSFTAIAEVGSRLLDDARASTRCACGPAAFVMLDTSPRPVGCSELAFRELMKRQRPDWFAAVRSPRRLAVHLPALAVKLAVKEPSSGSPSGSSGTEPESFR